jgi:ribose transport system permease protein
MENSRIAAESQSSPARQTAVRPGRSGAAQAIGRLVSRSYLLLVLLAMILVGSMVSEQFLTSRNALNVLSFSSIIALLAVGQFFVVLTGGIDLSVGAVLALATVVAALTMQAGFGAGAAILFTLTTCAFAGLVTGVLIVYLRIPPFITTLGMMTALQGISYIIQSSSLIYIENTTFVTLLSEGSMFGIRSPVYIFVAVTILAAIVARFTVFGRGLYAIGGNREASRLSGLPVNRSLLVTYTMSGVLAGMAGLVAAAQLYQGSSLIGRGYELDAIAAVVVGGATLMGGRGDPISAVVGVFILSIIVNIMNMMGISSEPQLVIKGAVILLAVYLSSAGGVDQIARLLGRGQGSR